MRLLGLFVGLALLLAAAVGAFDRVVDPAPQFYDGTPLRVAMRMHPQCLVSDELVRGVVYVQFKQDVFVVRHPTTVVLGSSRVLKIRSNTNETTFANLGLPETTPRVVLRLFRFMARKRPHARLTVYLGTEFFWFNPGAPDVLVNPPFHPTTFQRVGYLLSRATLRSALHLARASPHAAFHRWRIEHVGDTCVIDRESPNREWYPDGSRLYSFELFPGGFRPPRNAFTRNLATLRDGFYGNWHGFARDRFRQLEQALDFARAHGWKVVGFAPPDSSPFVHLFSTAPSTAGPWQTYFRIVPAAFRRRGFPFVDLRDVRDVPCREDDFVDAGYHVNAACAAKIRARLDAAAG